MQFSFDPSTTDVVFVGGGPVALWTAIQTKLQAPQANIVILEKYTEYQRIHNLFIEAASLNSSCQSPLFKDLVQSLKSSRTISTKELERTLAVLVEKVGVTIQRNIEILNPTNDLKPFSKAKVVVGADGAHSIMRQYIVDKPAEECLEVQKNLHYIADLTYTEKKEPISMIQKMSVNSTVGNCIYEIHSNKSQKTTLRTFISADSYEKMKNATRKTPKNIYSDEVDASVRQEYLTFLKSKYHDNFEQYVDLNDAAVTTTTLGSYISKKLVRKENDRICCLVGDAAFGVPFFRSLNNGFISGTKLAQTIAAVFNQHEGKQGTLWKQNLSFENYEATTLTLAQRQVWYADIKTSGINLWIKIAKMFQLGPSQYLKATYSAKSIEV